MFKLVLPSKEYEKDTFAYKQEFIENDDSMDGCGSLDKYDTYDEWMNHLMQYSDKNKIPPGSNYVEGSQYILVRECDNKICGMVNIRHYLNDFLLECGGHIGYSIRPSERRNGYAKQQLKLALDICSKKGIKKVLVTCDKDNIGSAKTIKSNGGILEDERYSDFFKHVIQRYWIQI
ncbi:MAG: GNAT family N-acetyltransferase [Erysipelotrichales bacterium]|nr:GNAT family N-acetyltransferase [Erysipelotrichales bacterium]